MSSNEKSLEIKQVINHAKHTLIEKWYTLFTLAGEQQSVPLLPLMLSHMVQYLPRSSSQNLQLSERPLCAESMVENGIKDTKDSIPWAMSGKY